MTRRELREHCFKMIFRAAFIAYPKALKLYSGTGLFAIVVPSLVLIVPTITFFQFMFCFRYVYTVP